VTASGTDFFDCDVSFPGQGAFEVYGSISASNRGIGATGFTSILTITATIVAQGAVNPAGTPVFVDVKQLYTSIASSMVTSNLRVDGACNNLRDSAAGIAFFINGGPGPGGPSNPVINPATTPPGPLFPCSPASVFTAGSSFAVAPGQPFLSLEQVGSLIFPASTVGGDAVTLQLQQVAFNPTGAAPPPPLVPPSIPAVKFSTADGMNEWVPLPDPADAFVMVFAGDIRNAIDQYTTATSPTVNAFAYRFGSLFADAKVTLDTSGNTVITFSGSIPGLFITSSDSFCYGGPGVPCNNLPHFGVAAFANNCITSTCTTLKMLKQYWSDNTSNLFPGLTVTSPAVTGSAGSFATVFAGVTTGGNTAGQWFQAPSATKTAPMLTFCNNTAAGETLSNVGFALSATTILQTMNFGKLSPPGTAGSIFTDLTALNGLFLPSRGCITFNPEPDIAVTTGVPTKQGTGLLVPVNLNNTGASGANNVVIGSIKPISPSTYIGPAIPLTLGNIAAAANASQNINIDTTGLSSGSLARFQINGSFQDGAGNNFQFSAVRAVRVPSREKGDKK